MSVPNDCHYVAKQAVVLVPTYYVAYSEPPKAETPKAEAPKSQITWSLSLREDILQARCAKCHSGSDPSGGVTLFNAEGLLPNKDAVINRVIRNNTMPPRKPLSEAERKEVLE